MLINRDIHLSIVASGIPKWRVAQTVGIADTTFSKWLRCELSPERKAMIQLAIQKLSNERECVNG